MENGSIGAPTFKAQSVPGVPTYEVYPASSEPIPIESDGEKGLTMFATIIPPFDGDIKVLQIVGIYKGTGVTEHQKLYDNRGLVIEVQTKGQNDEAKQRIADTIKDIGIVANVLHNPEAAAKIMHPETTKNKKRGYHGLG